MNLLCFPGKSQGKQCSSVIDTDGRGSVAVGSDIRGQPAKGLECGYGLVVVSRSSHQTGKTPKSGAGSLSCSENDVSPGEQPMGEA